MIYKCKLLTTFIFMATAMVYLICQVTIAQQKNKPVQDETTNVAQKIVESRCGSCHSTVAAIRKDALEVAQKEGPSLAFVGTKFRQEWLEKWLVAPTVIRPAGFLSFRFVDVLPTGDRLNDSLIPIHPALTSEEAKIVADYLMSLKQSVQSMKLVPANPNARPHIIFEKVLACGSCHQVEAGKGGLSGPELYTVAQRLNREWANSFMADPLVWSNAMMPKTEMRSEQISLISDYVFSANPASPTVGNVKKAKPNKAPVQLPTERAEALYKVYCSQCHGVSGNGKGINAPSLFVAPRNHTSFDEMSILNDDRISVAIKFGGAAVGKSSLMPSWNGILDDTDIQLLVSYLRKLSGTQAVLEHQRNQSLTKNMKK